MNVPSLKKLFEGRVIQGRYRLLRLLGEGNFGAVFHTRLEIFGEPVRDVAVKITKQTNLDKEEGKNVFGEAITLVRVYDQITDPTARNFIVPVYDLGLLEEHDRRGFIVMGLICGTGSNAQTIKAPETLGQKIGNYRRGMPPEMAVEYFRQICTGMAAVHDLKVVHRDLKPDNILLTAEGQVRIVDFGLAAGLNALGFAAGHVGTHRYMAPETALRGESDPRADVYSLGVMFYEMLTGKYPFEHLVPPSGMTSEERAAWVVEQKRCAPLPTPSATHRRPESWLDALVMDCLKFRVDDGRPKDAGHLLQRIAEGPDSGDAKIHESLMRADELLNVGWRRCFGTKPNWPGVAARLEEAAKQCNRRSDPRWFDAMTKLALCYVNMEIPSKADEILRQIEPEVVGGVFACSFREQAEFYEGFAKAFQGKRGMKHWAIEYSGKAKEARRKGNLA